MQWRVSIAEAQRNVPRTKTRPGTMWHTRWQRDGCGQQNRDSKKNWKPKSVVTHNIVTLLWRSLWQLSRFRSDYRPLISCLLIGQLSIFSASDWLRVSRSLSLVIVTLVTVFQVISHSVTTHQMSWEPWVLCGVPGPECVTFLVVISVWLRTLRRHLRDRPRMINGSVRE